MSKWDFEKLFYEIKFLEKVTFLGAWHWGAQKGQNWHGFHKNDFFSKFIKLSKTVQIKVVLRFKCKTSLSWTGENRWIEIWKNKISDCF